MFDGEARHVRKLLKFSVLFVVRDGARRRGVRR